jgi:2-C-methyl-D-erythritol 4-phosphate cytidylyltransferase
MNTSDSRNVQRKTYAIVPAAGMGKRFGPGTNKPFLLLGGQPLLIWALRTLESIPQITEIIPVLKTEDIEEARRMFEAYSLKKVLHIAPGGRERQDSVRSGLRLIQDRQSIVLIHDGVRPLIEKDLVHKAIEAMVHAEGPSPRPHAPAHSRVSGVVLGVPPKDTIKEAEQGFIMKTLARDSLRAVQTPQVFPCDVIADAYEKAGQEGYYSTDDAALVERYGGRIKVIPGSYLNIKITTPEDLVIAESLISGRISA